MKCDLIRNSVPCSNKSMLETARKLIPLFSDAMNFQVEGEPQLLAVMEFSIKRVNSFFSVLLFTKFLTLFPLFSLADVVSTQRVMIIIINEIDFSIFHSTAAVFSDLVID